MCRSERPIFYSPNNFSTEVRLHMGSGEPNRSNHWKVSQDKNHYVSRYHIERFAASDGQVSVRSRSGDERRFPSDLLYERGWLHEHSERRLQKVESRVSQILRRLIQLDYSQISNGDRIPVGPDGIERLANQLSLWTSINPVVRIWMEERGPDTLGEVIESITSVEYYDEAVESGQSVGSYYDFIAQVYEFGRRIGPEIIEQTLRVPNRPGIELLPSMNWDLYVLKDPGFITGTIPAILITPIINPGFGMLVPISPTHLLYVHHNHVDLINPLLVNNVIFDFLHFNLLSKGGFFADASILIAQDATHFPRHRYPLGTGRDMPLPSGLALAAGSLSSPPGCVLSPFDMASYEFTLTGFGKTLRFSPSFVFLDNLRILPPQYADTIVVNHVEVVKCVLDTGFR